MLKGTKGANEQFQPGDSSQHKEDERISDYGDNQIYSSAPPPVIKMSLLLFLEWYILFRRVINKYFFRLATSSSKMPEDEC
ncbi:hypothetical protein C0J52_25114 [Blattella germanica]|nr:hypothetical protein C0J52_25114 [Blattella germanica]